MKNETSNQERTMETNKNRWTVGQVVKTTHPNRHDRHESLARVTKVWKNGGVEIGSLDGLAVGSRIFNPDGSERGKYGSIRLEALADGETVESFQAAQKAKADAARAEAAKKQTEQVAKVQTWWSETGKAMWDARITLPEPFLGETVHIIRFQRYDEWYMPFVVVKQVKRWGDENAIELTVGGLVGKEYDTGDDTDREHHKSINTFSLSSSASSTLEAALYNVCH